jgi:hypothetical protein
VLPWGAVPIRAGEMASYLTASRVTFHDDSALSKRSTELDALDSFYISRLNDPSTYFFTWFAKRYNLTLHATPQMCPICLETVTNSIQLSCGECACTGLRVSY